MATCPRCGGFLGARHRCSGLWRLRLRFWGALLVGGIIGAAVGALVLSLVYDEISWYSVALAAFIGIFIMTAVRLGEPPAKAG